MDAAADRAELAARPAEPRELRTALAPRAVGLVLEEDSRKIVEMTLALVRSASPS